MKIDRAVVALRVRAADGVRERFSERRFDRPPERVDRADRQDRRRAVPSGVPQSLAAVFRAERLECPRGVGSELRCHAEFAQNLLRFLVARDHQRVAAVALAHLLQQRIHRARFAAVRHAQFVMCRRDAQRAHDHRGERIGEFALEHRTFAGHHAIVFRHFGMKERRENIREMHLLRVAEISAREFEILRHHRPGHILGAQDALHLPDDFFHANVGAGVARAVVAGEKQLQRLARLPGLARAEHVLQFVQLDRGR